jgi:hypothetical protein
MQQSTKQGHGMAWSHAMESELHGQRQRPIIMVGKRSGNKDAELPLRLSNGSNLIL